MAPRLRKMKAYHPRKRSKNIELQKTALHDIKHKISTDIGTLVVLIKDGNADQIPIAQQKAKNDFAKHAEEMNKIAQKMGDHYAKAVRDYLDSVDVIIHCNTAWIDEAKIRHCYAMSEKLEKEIRAAA